MNLPNSRHKLNTLDKEAFTKACIDMDSKVVVNFYPKCPRPDLTLGLKCHTDPSTITVLFQDQVDDLQITKDGSKTWISVQPVEGAFIVNLGDHGHFLSNGRFKNSNSSSLSVVTFQNPAPEAIVYLLAITEGEKPVHGEPITYIEMYRRKMCRHLKLAKLKKMAKAEQEGIQKAAR